MKKHLTILCALLLYIGFMNAQCGDTASYTAVIDPANNGVVTFTNTSIETDTSLTYTWNFGDGEGAITADRSTVTHTFNGIGNYTVCLMISDSTGSYMDSTSACYSSYCTTIYVVNTLAYCNANFFINTDSTGGTYFANTSSGMIANYSWDFGDGTTSTSPNPPIHHYTTGGYYVICLTTTNPATVCNSTFCDTILISSCTASYTYTPDATGDGVTFNGSSTGTGTIFNWDFGDGTTSSLQNPYHLYTANGSYHVCMTASSPTDSTCYSTTCQYVSVSGLCSASFYVSSDSSLLTPTYYIYSYASGSGTVSYLWDFGDGSTSTAPYPTHTYATSGPFLICLTVSDGLGCSDTHCDSIGLGHSMSTPITLYVINATGIQEQTTIISSLENYPNPFSDNTTISYLIKKDATVELNILDLLGNNVATIEKGNKSSGSYTVNWNSEGISEGMYLLQLKVGNSISTKKLMISK